MSAVLKSPFDPYIQQILSSPQYLTSAHAAQLVEMLKKTFPTLFENAASANGIKVSPHELLANTIEALGETIKRLNTAASMAEGGLNATDLKKVVDAQEKQIKILARLSDTLTANEKQSALENALIEALDESDNKALKELFLKKFHAKLSIKSHSMGSI